MHSSESMYDVIVFSNRALNGTVKGYKKDLLSPKLLAIRCSLHESEQGFVMGQDYKLASWQLGFEKVEAIDNSLQLFLEY